MPDANQPPELISIRELLSKDQYLIPMYQRNYAWGEGEINQLIQDIQDFSTENKPYYIGTLIVSERKEQVYEVIDGQQRLTTLSLLAMALKHREVKAVDWYEKPNLEFESRESSRKTIESVFDQSYQYHPERAPNEGMLTGYELICKRLDLNESERSSAANDAQAVSNIDLAGYLFDQVKIARVEVPKHTDLNHYFEIMNNRGEQLEKHEILKYRLIKALDGIVDEAEGKQAKHAFHTIWEACSNMEKYLQMYFSAKSQRAKLFGQNWGEFVPKDFDDFSRIIHEEGSDSNHLKEQATLLSKLIGSETGSLKREGGSQQGEESERFHPVINFPNFLLQTLKSTMDASVKLDDKGLIDEFEKVILKSDFPIEKVKLFGYHLLRTKWLFDSYVIKREFTQGADRWSLKKILIDDSSSVRYRISFSARGKDQDGDDDESNVGRRILMLLSAFHVSAPTMAYKHWLNAALSYLVGQDGVSADDYLKHMESVAKTFVFDRHLASDPMDYQTMIHTNKGCCVSDPEKMTSAQMTSYLMFGKVSNFVFNYLDYLLWIHEFKEMTYDFTFRSSVEHFYPQHPVGDHPQLPPELGNSFGNLCLISHSKNSKLSNNLPAAKREYYGKAGFDSFKQKQMLDLAEEWSPTHPDTITQHEKEMLDLLRTGVSAST